jgi:hypothetical protein
VDFKQAYDSINHKKLYKIRHDVGIPSKLIRLVTATMKDSEAQVKGQTQLTEPFKIRQGLKQGDGLAHHYLTWLLIMSSGNLSVNIKGTLQHHPAQIMGYADYMSPE